MGIVLMMCVIVVACIVLPISNHNLEVRKRNKEKMKGYKRIMLNMTYSQCSQILRELGSGSLVEQSFLDDGRRKEVYKWYLGWHTVGTSRGYGTFYNRDISGLSYGQSLSSGNMVGNQSARTHIMLTFINDRLVAKTQQGLF